MAESEKGMTFEIDVLEQTENKPERGERGRFLPGQSGNSSGRPKLPAEFTELAREHTVAALQTIIDVLTDTKAKAGDRLRAAEIMLDRGWGKPLQASQINLDADVTNQQLIVTFSNPELDEWSK
ncbi:MAG: DUF5681 domain-containing protein [Syntrophomonas sp.]